MKKLRVIFGIFVVISSLVLIGFGNNPVFAEETSGYMMAEDISAHLTFTFKDGVETHEFPVFKTTEDFVANQGTSFQVQRVVGESPHLHKALDEKFKNRLAFSSTNYNYKIFDIDVEFTHADGKYNVKHFLYSGEGGDDNLLPSDVKPRKTLYYVDCQIEDYLVDTVYNTYRSYGQAETGFAIVEIIDFKCSGISSEVGSKTNLLPKTNSGTINDFGKLNYTYADNIRTFVTLEFDNGIERIEFPIFHLLSGFGEDDDPSFHVEGVPNRYPLLANAIDNARDSRNSLGGSNIDFNANVEFVQETEGGDKFLRGINYKDCNIAGSGITTYHDNEEGYLFIGGMAILQTIDFDCAGMDPLNPRYDESITTNEQNRDYNMASGPQATAEFKFKDNTFETIDFPIFRDQKILSKSDTIFQLEGMVGDYPLLYNQVDDAARINQISGVTQTHKLFDVDVSLKYDDQTVRGFSYSDCRVIDYLVATEQQNEEGFWVGFALENTFEFECLGYKPKIKDDGTILETDIDNKTTTWSGITFDGYLQAEEVTANLTFTFRDGVETHEFPVFKTTSDHAENRGTSFQIQGVIADTPHLHKALDEAFKYRLTNTAGGFDYNYKYFDVDAVLLNNDGSRKIYLYKDCQIADHLVDTLSHTQRGYLSQKNGFAIVETIDFECNGLHSKVTMQDELSFQTEPNVVNDFGKSEYSYADNVRAFVTFEFANGIEKIEFPLFKTISGFAEDDDPSFHVEGIENRYPLLNHAIDNARDERNLSLGTNIDFNANVEFVQEMQAGEEKLRGIYYENCRVIGSDITTYYDKEEPFATVGGFAINHSIDFDCAGMTPLNPLYDKSITINEESRNYKMGSGIHSIAEFKFKDNTIEIIDFPFFKQQDVLSKSDATFQLKGMVGDYPLLYNQVDDAARINQISGTTQIHDLFDVDVNLKYDDQTVRGFSYSDCRVADYIIATQQGNEEAFFFWFAIENTFEFECLGYKPKNPIYDAMFETEKSHSISTLDLRATDTWSDEFKYKPKS